MAAPRRPSAPWSTWPAPRTACRPASTSSTTDETSSSDDESTDEHSDPELLKIGRVTKAHGLKGEVVIQLWTDHPERLSPGSVLSSPAGPLHVLASKPSGADRWIVSLEGLVDREGADRLRGVELSAEPLDEPGTLWVHELVGAVVRDVGGVELGRVASVEANPASDLLVLESGGLIPVRFVTAHDAVGRTVDVDIPEGLLDL